MEQSTVGEIISQLFTLGNVDLEPKEEKAWRRAIVEEAIEALQTELTEQRLFPRPKIYDKVS